jgi:hypothetical protein
MSHHDLLSRLTQQVRTVLGADAVPARRRERRVRPQVERLEEMVMPSTVATTPVPLTKFNGTYKISFVGKAPAPGGYHALKGSFGVLIKNGKITDVGVRGGGYLTRTGSISANANVRGVYMRWIGKAFLNAGRPAAKGTWTGTYLIYKATGTWFASPARIPGVRV